MLVLVTGACGAGSTPGAAGVGEPAVVVDQVLAGRVPDGLRSDGKLVVGIDPTLAPAEFLDTDDTTVIGFDVDLFNAVAAKLGLRPEYARARFDDIVPGVISGRYEIGVSSFTVTDAREQQVLMVSYFQAGTQWVSRQGNPLGVDPKSACGRTVAVQATTVQEADLANRSRDCTAAKKPAITADPYQETDQVTAAVLAGKADAMIVDSSVGGYAVVRSGGALQPLGDVYAGTPYGYVVPKTQQPLAEAVRDAVKALIADGSYPRLLARWGVQGGAITEPVVNP